MARAIANSDVPAGRLMNVEDTLIVRIKAASKRELELEL